MAQAAPRAATRAPPSRLHQKSAALDGVIDPAVVEVSGVNVDVTKTSLRTLSMPAVSLISLSSDEPPPPVTPTTATTTRTPTSITSTFKALEPGPKDDVEVVFPAAHVSWSMSPELLAAMESAAKKAP